MTLQNILIPGSKSTIPVVNYINEANLTQAASQNLGTIYNGNENPHRCNLMMVAGNWYPTGTVNQYFTINGTNSVYNKSNRLANGTYIDASFSAYVDRDGFMIGPQLATGTNANVVLQNSTSGATFAGKYWWFSIDNLLLQTAPISTAYTTTNSTTVTVPAGGLLIMFMASLDAGSTMNIGTTYGTTYIPYGRYWSVYIYQNTGSSSTQTMTWANSPSNNVALSSYVLR
jgi:hypothetical protein